MRTFWVVVVIGSIWASIAAYTVVGGIHYGFVAPTLLQLADMIGQR